MIHCGNAWKWIRRMEKKKIIIVTKDTCYNFSLLFQHKPLQTLHFVQMCSQTSRTLTSAFGKCVHFARSVIWGRYKLETVK